MGNIKVFSHSLPTIGYTARTVTKGNEFEMVNKYIEHLLSKYKSLKKKKIAIFIEPQIETGYPDIVIVEYYDCSENLWNQFRSKLSNSDLKILFEIQMRKNISIASLVELLGFSYAEIRKAVLRLNQCNLVHISKENEIVRNIELHAFCHVNKVISIEAKINKWTEAIRQASMNVWFSTESYILMNKDSCNDEIIHKCKEKGIGIILINGKINKVLVSEQRKFPVSYSSLQFNEWIQRSLHT